MASTDEKIANYVQKCTVAIQKAIESDSKSVFIDLSWFDEDAARMSADPIMSYLLFNPESGQMVSDVDRALNQLEKHFRNPPFSVELCFGGVDGGSICSWRPMLPE